MRFPGKKLLLGLLCAVLASCAQGPSPEIVAQRVEGLVGPYRSGLVAGLSKTQSRITEDEWKIVSGNLSKHPTVSLQVYLNRYGEVRWHRDVTMVGKTFDEFLKQYRLETDAVEQSYVSKTAKVRLSPDARSFEVSVPLIVEKEVVGILLFSAAAG